MRLYFKISLFRKNPEVSNTNICIDETIPFIELMPMSGEPYWATIDLPDGKKRLINIDELYNAAKSLKRNKKTQY